MLGVCVPREPEQGLLYDRLPLPVPCDLPVGLNAQFDPDTARSTLHERSWNAHRFAELGDFLAAVAVELFTRATHAAPGERYRCYRRSLTGSASGCVSGS